MVGHSFSGPASAFPSRESWKDFNTLFNLNKPSMFASGDSGEDVGRIFNAINSAAKAIGVEERVILAIIIQESSGNVGVVTTGDNDSLADRGLMQCEGSPGFPGQHNLSQAQISGMVNAGTAHFKANLRSNDDSDTAAAIYEALRLYNSGSVDKANLSDGRGATPSYVSDVANRLLGVVN